jgi:proteasome accessory factor A
MECARELDWVAKLHLLERYRDRDHLDWRDAKLHLIDVQYYDTRLSKGLYHHLVRAGHIDRLLTDEEIAEAVTEPPLDTRAYFRGRCLANYSSEIAASSWDSVIFDLPGRDSLQRIATMEPMRGTKEHVGRLFDSSKSASDLVNAITGH